MQSISVSQGLGKFSRASRETVKWAGSGRPVYFGAYTGSGFCQTGLGHRGFTEYYPLGS